MPKNVPFLILSLGIVKTTSTLVPSEDKYSEDCYESSKLTLRDFYS
jgi:hypothetical protein